MKWFVIKKTFKIGDTSYSPAEGDDKRRVMELDPEETQVKTLIESKSIEETELDGPETVRHKMAAGIKEALVDVVTELLPQAVSEATMKLNEGLPSGVKSSIKVGETLELEDPYLGLKGAGHFMAVVRDNAANKQSGKTMPEPLVEYLSRIEQLNRGADVPGQKVFQNEGIGDEGSILAPAEISNQIREIAFAPHTLMGACDQYSIRGNSITFPRSKDTSRATGARHAGVTSAWLSAGEQLTMQKIEGLDEVGFKLGKLGVLTGITSEMIADGGTIIEQWVAKNVAKEIGFQVNLAIWEGDGVKKPLGFMASDALLSIPRTVASEIRAADIQAMCARFFASSLLKAKWYVHQRIPWQHFLGMWLSDGENTAISTWPVFLPPGGPGTSFAEAPGGVLMGRPVVPMEFCQPPGTAKDVVLADMSEMALITKGGAGSAPAIDTAMSIHFLFDYDVNAYRALYRLDAQPWQNSLITPFRDTSGITYATFITLTDAE